MTTTEPVPSHHGDARARALAAIAPRIGQLRAQAALHPDAHVDVALVSETIALLKSLLPVNPAADKQAQVDMAAERAAPVARSIFALIETVCKRGGEVVVCAGDMLNPGCGYDARATWPNGSRNGHSERANSGMYESGQYRKADPIEALARLAAKVSP